MSIKSYLAHPFKGEKNQLMKELLEIKGCEVIPSENKNVLILITDTQTKKQEQFIESQLTAGFLREFILFKTSERSRTFALSVSSIW